MAAGYFSIRSRKYSHFVCAFLENLSSGEALYFYKSQKLAREKVLFDER